VLRGGDDAAGSGMGAGESCLSAPRVSFVEAFALADCAEDRASMARRERMLSSSSESESGIVVLVGMHNC